MAQHRTEPVTHQQLQTSRLTEEVRELREQLRASQAKCDELSIQLHNKQPGRIVRRKLHAVLDLVQRITPEGVRARFRPVYRRVYRRLFPHGAREFGSADLVKLGEKKQVAERDARKVRGRYPPRFRVSGSGTNPPPVLSLLSAARERRLACLEPGWVSRGVDTECPGPILRRNRADCSR